MPRGALVLAALLCAAMAAPIGWSRQDDPLERVRAAARAEVAAGTMPGLAVAIVHGGALIVAEGFGVAHVEAQTPAAAETVFQVGSVGKMLTAAAALEASGAGALALREGIGRRVKGLAPAIADLTLHQLLAHVSGMRDMPGAHGELGDEAHGRFLRTLTDADRILPPGATFSYSNLGYSLAGLAVAEATGVDYAAAVERLVIDPAGMSRTTLRPTVAMTRPLAVGHQKQKDGSFAVVRPMAHDTRLWPAGYLFSTARDLARFALALLDEGRLDGRQALRRETVAAMLTPHAELPRVFDGWRYGYGLILMPMRGLRVAEHAGSMVGSAALVRLVPDHEFAVIALSNSDTPAMRTVDAAVEAFLPLAPPPPRADAAPAPQDPATVKRYEGRYVNRGVFVLAAGPDGLTLRQNDGPELKVSRLADDMFVAAGPNNPPRLRFMLQPARTGQPATLHFGLWAFPRVDLATAKP